MIHTKHRNYKQIHPSSNMNTYYGVNVLDEGSIVLLLQNIYRALIRQYYEDVHDRIQTLFTAMNTTEVSLAITKEDYNILYNNIAKSLLESTFHRPDDMHPYIRDTIYHFANKYIPDESGMLII